MPAPKGNKNAIGNEGGRPPLFNNPNDLQGCIDAYFVNCKLENLIPTISGLCYSCGFESRQSFYDYEDKIEFTYIIKRARLRIEMVYEERLQGNNATGSIFALKNMGWHDKTETEHSGEIKTTDLSKLSPEEIIKLAEAVRYLEKNQ